MSATSQLSGQSIRLNDHKGGLASVRTSLGHGALPKDFKVQDRSRVSMSMQLDRRERRRAIAQWDSSDDEDAGLDRFYKRNFVERVPGPPMPVLREDAGFMERLSMAWSVLFPTDRPQSIAQVAKKRLSQVLNADRMQVSPHLKHQLCVNVVDSMSEYVVVNKEAEVQFAVHRSPESGSVYMIKVPVQRVKPELQLQMQPVIESMHARR